MSTGSAANDGASPPHVDGSVGLRQDPEVRDLASHSGREGVENPLREHFSNDALCDTPGREDDQAEFLTEHATVAAAAAPSSADGASLPLAPAGGDADVALPTEPGADPAAVDGADPATPEAAAAADGAAPADAAADADPPASQQPVEEEQQEAEPEALAAPAGVADAPGGLSAEMNAFLQEAGASSGQLRAAVDEQPQLTAEPAPVGTPAAAAPEEPIVPAAAAAAAPAGPIVSAADRQQRDMRSTTVIGDEKGEANRGGLVNHSIYHPKLGLLDLAGRPERGNKAMLASPFGQIPAPDAASLVEAAAEAKPVKAELAEEPGGAADDEVSCIPRHGPRPHGVWTGCLEYEYVGGGVALLREYLVQNWTDRSLPLEGGDTIYPYADYTLTSAKYSQQMQVMNTLRFKGTKSRVNSVRKCLPGFSVIEQACLALAEQRFPPRLAAGLELFNAHILRQYFDADSGSGFGYHIDVADDAPNVLLYLSVGVKLTADPAGADGSWMQVEGFQPVRYGSRAGSVVMFLSRTPHWSLRTPPNMTEVLKIVLFFRFRAGSQLAELYRSVAPPSRPQPPGDAAREYSVLPPQQQPVGTAAPSKPEVDEFSSVDKFRARSLKAACGLHFESFKPALQLCWKQKLGQKTVINVKKVGGVQSDDPFAQTLYGHVALVCVLVLKPCYCGYD